MTRSHALEPPSSNSSLSLIALGSLFVLVATAAVDLELANRVTVTLRDAVTSGFDWLFVGTVTFALLAAAAVIAMPSASLRLGSSSDRPEFSRLSWFAMLFSAGLASGLVYWGTAEPMTHFIDNPFATVGLSPAEQASLATTITVFHWGLHGWGLYAIVGLAIALSAFRHGNRLTFSSALTPIFGASFCDTIAGRAVDLLAVFGTVFGVATSIGLAVSSMNATLQPLTGIEVSTSVKLGIVAVVCILAVLSVLSGVERGIRRLSECNVWLSLALLITLFLLGPTLWLLVAFPNNLIEYAISALPMGLFIADSAEDLSWQTDWTIFYWGWWLAWTPFVALFIARISKGRTVREFVLGVLAVPPLVVIVWMTVFGGIGLHQEMAEPGVMSAVVTDDYSQGLVAMIGALPVPELHSVLLAIVAVLLFSWLITSLDSATLVVCHLLRQQDSPRVKVLWGTVLGAVTATLILVGGLTALQAASIIIGLPMAIVMLAMTPCALLAVTRADRSAEGS